MNPDQAQRQHERLCAYLLGELEGEERSAFEAELESSAELRAERDRIEGTISLVRQEARSSESLSPAARAALVAAAGSSTQPKSLSEPAPVHPWPVRLLRSPDLAAAALLVVLAGLAVIAMEQAGKPKVRVIGDTADAPAAVRTARERDTLQVEERSISDASGFGQATGSPEFPGNEAGGYKGPSDSIPSAGEDKQAGAELNREQAEVESQFSGLEKLGNLSEGEPQDSGTPAGDRLPGEAVEEIAADLKSVTAPITPEEQASLSALGYSLGYVAGGGGQGQAGTVVGGGGGGAPAAPTSAGPGTPGPVAGGAPGLSKRSGGGSYGGRFGGRSTTAGKAASPGREGLGIGSENYYLGVGEDGSVAGTEIIGGVQFWSLGETLAPPDSSRPDERRGLLREGLKSTEEAEVLEGDADTLDRGLRLTPQERERYCDDIIRLCRVRPEETPSMMFFRCWGDNPFELAQLDALSTFAADVDTASYTLARNYLGRDLMPTKAQIRTEEFVNYFDAGVPAPAAAVFDINMEMAPSFFGEDGHWMLRVVLAGKEVDKLERQNLALTFVVDTSGSMKKENRMELVKHSLRLLVGELFPNDAISIVAFSREARLVLPMTSASNRGVIESAIFGLQPDGGTNAEGGLRMGYEVAGAGLTAGANNRVVLLSDGVANIGDTKEASLLDSVAMQRSKGIYLNTIGVGMGNHNDALLEQLANKGDGICNYIDTSEEARRALVDNFTGAFQAIARDVKIQVEFDPAQVASYRLLGYENRAVADVQFRDDKVDAGEVGAGHQVTALFELSRNPTATNDGPLATARVRFKPPFAVDQGKLDAASAEEAETAQEIAQAFEFHQVSTEFRGATPGYQQAVLVAQLAESLRRSVHARGDSFDRFLKEALRLEKELRDSDFTAFCTLVAQRAELIERNLPADDDLTEAIDELTRHNYLKGQLEQLHEKAGELDAEVLETLRRSNDDLEARIRELINQYLEGSGR